MGKEEIAHNEQFLLFPQGFLLKQKIVSLFVHIFDIISLSAAELEEPKTGISGKGLRYLTTKVCNGVPWKASISLITCPFVETTISLPSGLNFIPVQSHSLSCGSLKVANGPY